MRSAPLSVWLGLCLYTILTLSLYPTISALRVVTYVVENPSEGIDIAYAVCISDDALYVVGSSGYRMFIESVSISNNSRLFSWVSNWVGELYDCVAVNSSIFVVGTKREGGVGRWFVGVFDEMLNLVSWRESYSGAAALSISYGNGHLYIAGYGSAAAEGRGDIFWIVERVDVKNISNFIYAVSNPSGGSDIASAVGVNPATGEVWVVGTEGDRRTWRVEVYDENLGLIASRDLGLPNYPYSIDLDSSGNAYVVGTSHVVKIGRGLEVVAKAEVGGTKAVLYNDSHLILVAQHSNELGFQSHYIYVLDSDLDVVGVLCATCGRNYSVYADRGRAALAGRKLYAAGYGIASGRHVGDSFIVLYSIQIPESLPVVHRAGGGGNTVDIKVLLAIAVASVAATALAIRFARGGRKVARSRRAKKK